MAELLRPRSGRVIAGVCVAIANRFDMSVAIIRALMVIGVLLFGLSVWLYVILWLLIPLDRS
jgi:phage shock protein PspC (stress-responsive transcriptional regulator)